MPGDVPRDPISPPKPPPTGRRRLRSAWTMALIGVAVVGGGIGVWLATDRMSPFAGTDEVPVIHADPAPFKERPETPGGMEVPNRDKLVYDRIGGDSDGRPLVVERLLPPPEQPLPLPGAPAEGPVEADGQEPAEPTDVANAEDQPPAPPVESDEPTTEEILAAMRPPAAPRVDAPPAPPMETAAKSPAKAAPDTVGAPAGVQVQLAAVRSREQADSEWKRLRRRHGDVLGKLSPSVMKADLGAKGVFYRLRAGPVRDEANARALCAILADRKVGCLVVRRAQ